MQAGDSIIDTSTKTLLLTTRLHNGAHNTGEAQVEQISLGQRIGKALLCLFVGLVVTAFSILVPLLHFILVPVFLMFTIVATIMAGASGERITSAYGNCPGCSKQFQIHARAPRFPFQDVCDHCHRAVTVELAGDNNC